MTRVSKCTTMIRMSEELGIRPIEKADEEVVAGIVRQVMKEYGAGDPGTPMHDREPGSVVDDHSGEGSGYYVVAEGTRILGGGGFGPLAGNATGELCELRKLYLLREARGFGLGRRIVEKCLAEARAHGYRFCYLETMSSMIEARHLYESIGFERCERPSGVTGQFGCDTWMRLGL